jgi:hypothetical protein
MKRHFASLIALMAISLLISSVAIAQTTSGEIRGRVIDSAEAALTGAEVTLTNQLTGDRRVTTTDNSGDFIFVAVQPGTFEVSAKAPGFKEFTKRDLQLSASQRLSAGNLKLQVGSVTETMTVTAEATPLQTESAERSALLDSKEISTLMTPGRDVLALTRLLPGVVKDGEGASTLGTQGPGTISGVRESSNAVTMDGVTGNVRGDGNKFDTPLNMDAVGEVKILLNNYQAEYGSSAGGVINLTTKSGTQQFHGSGYYYGRNEAFNANSWFNNFKGNPRGQYRFNTVGYNIGGPIYIPGHFNSHKDKLFFFFSQEIWPTKTNSGFQQFMMPTAAERNGDFSNTYDAKGQKVFVKDPTKTGTCSASSQAGCFTNNIIPANRINANTQKLLNIFPLPTINCAPFGQGGATPCPLTNVTSGNPYNYSIFAPRKEPTNQQVLRVDYNINSKLRMYFHGMNMFKENRGLTATTNKLNWGIPSYYQTPAQNTGINLSYFASPTLVNEFSVGWAGWKEQQNFANTSDLAKVSRSALGISLGQNNPLQNPTDLVPRVTGLSSGSSSPSFQLANAPSIDFDNRWPMKNATGTWEGTDGLTKIWGRHTSKVGAYYQAGRYLQRHIGSTFNGNFNFGASTSNPNDTQYAYSNMLLGSYSSYQEGSNAVDYAPHWHILEWYLQDNWKVRSNLSLDYGLRFTYDMPTDLAPGFGASFVPGRYDPSQVPALYRPVLFSKLSATQQAACKGTLTTTPTRCSQNPLNPNDVKSDAFSGTFVSPFGYTGTVVNTDTTYPRSLRQSNGVLYAPRLGIAWDPYGDGKSVIRMGAGLYYNTREGGGTVGDYSLIAPLVKNSSVTSGQITSTTFLPGCGSTNTCFGSGLVNPNPQDTRILQPNRKIESTLSTNLGFQRKLGFDTVMDIGYVGTFGRHLNQQVNLNAIPYLAQFDPKFVDPTQTSTNNFFFGPHHNGVVLSQPKLLSDNYFRPYLGYGAINLRDYGATSNYHALQTSVNRRFTRGLQFGVSYTWSKTLTTQDTVNGAVANFQDRRFWNYGLADFDRTHIFVAHWVWSVPKASSIWDNKFMRAIGDNWEYSGIAEFVSGHPLAVTMSGTPNLTGGGDGARVLLFGSPYAPKDQVHTTLQFLNQSAFVMPSVSQTVDQLPGPNTPGITRAAIFRGPGTNNFDMGLQKNIPITERVRFSVRVEAYNVFNHPSFTMTDSSSSHDLTADFDTRSTCTGASLNDPVCGSGLISSGSVFGQVNGERGARILQLSGRITF